MMAKEYVSWGRYPYKQQKGFDFSWRNQELPENTNFLPQGNARSYGDSCMNQNGVVVSSRKLNRFIHYDQKVGLIRCEAGVTLSQILDLVEPHGWFLHVTPGTKFVTVGGALANDVHGKNHHVAGSFGRYVTQFEIMRSDGSRMVCSPSENADYFAATVGGLGLTGFIVWVELNLKKVENSAVNVENIKYNSLSEFFTLSEDSEEDYEYTVAWVDCLAKGEQAGRGHFSRANHAKNQVKPSRPKVSLSVPVDPPLSMINSLTLKAFNSLYYNRQREERAYSTVHYDPFFYPLDGIKNWNRVYGPKGFLQFQCVVSPENSESAIREILERISAANRGSFLAVLKVFGDVPSPGLLSFPRPGATLALDFPYQGAKTLALLDQLDDVVFQANGAIYPAKDAHMSGSHYRQYYPKVEQFKQFIDPAISSSFWSRVMEEK